MYLVLLIDAPFHNKLTLPIVNKTTFVCEILSVPYNVYSVKWHVLVATPCYIDSCKCTQSWVWCIRIQSLQMQVIRSPFQACLLVLTYSGFTSMFAFWFSPVLQWVWWWNLVCHKGDIPNQDHGTTASKFMYFQSMNWILWLRIYISTVDIVLWCVQRILYL